MLCYHVMQPCRGYRQLCSFQLSPWRISASLIVNTTRGFDIKSTLDNILSNTGISVNNLVSVVTDGAPALLGKNLDLIGLLKNDLSLPEFLPFHSIVYRGHLVTKYVKYENAVKTVLKSRTIFGEFKTRKFMNFLEKLDLDDFSQDIIFYCRV